MDSGLYPIAKWGVERAAALGKEVFKFQHYDAEALYKHLRKNNHRDIRPLVVTDGLCPRCGKAAPIADYLKQVRKYGGKLIIDDTQALGILGHLPGPDVPYGRGGGGVLRWSNIGGPDVLLVCSLAKGFGVPGAVISGSDFMVHRFKKKSKTRVHCSPPSTAVIHAAEHALKMNIERGNYLRLRLANLVRRFRKRLAGAGFSAKGGLFPVQTIAPMSNFDASIIHKRLLQEGIRTVLMSRSRHRACLGFIISAQHSPDDIDYAVDALEYATSNKMMKHNNRQVNYE
jgi:8-amino-7-oxononanoate synthase